MQWCHAILPLLADQRRIVTSRRSALACLILVGGLLVAINGLSSPSTFVSVEESAGSPHETSDAIWGVSIGEELTWVKTKQRGPDGPLTGTTGLNVPVGNRTQEQLVDYTEGDSWRYVITSFGQMYSTALGYLPAAYGNLTLNGVTGINDCLFHWVRPVNINWTQYAESRTAPPPGHDPVWEYVVERDTADIFEFRVINTDIIDIPGQEGEEGHRYRYDKHRGLLLHKENLERQQSAGYFGELDFLGPPYQTEDSGFSNIAPLCWLTGLLLSGVSCRKRQRKRRLRPNKLA